MIPIWVPQNVNYQLRLSRLNPRKKHVPRKEQKKNSLCRKVSCVELHHGEAIDRSVLLKQLGARLLDSPDLFYLLMQHSSLKPPDNVLYQSMYSTRRCIHKTIYNSIGRDASSPLQFSDRHSICIHAVISGLESDIHALAPPAFFTDSLKFFPSLAPFLPHPIVEGAGAEYFR